MKYFNAFGTLLFTNNLTGTESARKTRLPFIQTVILASSRVKSIVYPEGTIFPNTETLDILYTY